MITNGQNQYVVIDLRRTQPNIVLLFTLEIKHFIMEKAENKVVKLVHFPTKCHLDKEMF